jgi:hypothetical protein
MIALTLAVVSALTLVACTDNGDGDATKKGLSYKKIDGVYTIYKYVGEGNLEMARKEQHSILPCLREADSETFPLGYKKLMEKASGIPFGNKGDEL